MKRSILILFVGALVCTLSTITEAISAPRENTLKIYNWADYLDDTLLDEFVVWYREQTGEDVKIVYQTYDLNEVALAKIERAKADYDLVCPSDYIIERMLKRDLLVPIDKDFGDTPNYIDNISPYLTECFSVINTPDKNIDDYSTPHMWSITGLLYNTQNVTREEALSWGVLWDEKYAMRVLMKDDSRQIYGITRLYLNQEMIESGIPMEVIANQCSTSDIAQVETELIKARQNVAGFEMDFGKEVMTKGRADVSIQYNGDAYWARDEATIMGVDLDFVVPMEGSVIVIDAWVIPKYARNVKAASYFINFMCRPDNAVRNMDYVGYSTAIAAPEVLEYITDNDLDTTSDLSYFFGEQTKPVSCDPLLFPTIDEVNRCIVMRDFDNRTEDIMIMWATVKGDNLSRGMVIFIIITILLFAGINLRQYLYRRRHRR